MPILSSYRTYIKSPTIISDVEDFIDIIERKSLTFLPFPSHAYTRFHKSYTVSVPR